MIKIFKYRIYPTKKQVRIMSQWLEECRWLHNYFLEERRKAWEERKESLSYHKQAKELPELKKKRPSLTIVYSQVLQNVAVRVDLAFKHFFRRVKNGEKPGIHALSLLIAIRVLPIHSWGSKLAVTDSTFRVLVK